MIFQGLSVAKNCFRPETGPLIVLAIKRGILFNLTKTLRGGLFIGRSGTDLKFSITVEFKPFFAQSFKNMLKISILDLKKRGYFFSNFAFLLKCHHFCIAMFDNLIFSNILNLQMNFGNLY